MTRWMIGAASALILLAGASPPVWGHKDKLPTDALTLVRQATGLLAQNPGMRGEARERLEAALRSKQTQGVHMDQIAQALRALEGNDLSSARRLLTASIMPAGMAMPPSGPSRSTGPSSPPSAPAPSVPQRPSRQAPAGGMQPAGTPPDVETAMRTAEPLRSRFGGSRREIILLLAGVLIAGTGLMTFRRTEAHRP
ncbi:MAG TPA: hypothetical protein VI007_11960 [bacterium]